MSTKMFLLIGLDLILRLSFCKALSCNKPLAWINKQYPVIGGRTTHGFGLQSVIKGGRTKGKDLHFY